MDMQSDNTSRGRWEVSACRAGQHVIVFLERGPLYLVAAAATGEPVAVLLRQLDLLHAHLLAILTDGFDRTLARNPRFEPRRLLGEDCPDGDFALLLPKTSCEPRLRRTHNDWNKHMSQLLGVCVLS